MSNASESLSIVIPTCNRGDSVVATVQSILDSEHTDLEIIIVDQSDDDETHTALIPWLKDIRVNYIHTPVKGAGNARNLGVRAAIHEFVALTDDDCIVAPNWPQTIVNALAAVRSCAVLYTNVLPVPHDTSEGFVPEYNRIDNKRFTTAYSLIDSQGLGASMAVRRSLFLQLGGFDQAMGPGSPFRSASDRDIALRAILRGHTVLETAETFVLHDGFRTWEQGKDLTRRDWFGLGAMCIKPLKLGYLSTLPLFIHYLVGRAIIRPLTHFLRDGKPFGLKRSIYFLQGVLHGLKADVSGDTLTYQQEHHHPAQTNAIVF